MIWIKDFELSLTYFRILSKNHRNSVKNQKLFKKIANNKTYCHSTYSYNTRQIIVYAVIINTVIALKGWQREGRPCL